MVVVVDDSAAAISQYEASVRSLEVDIQAFRSADDAYAYLRENPADLLFLDIVMPKKDGFTLLGGRMLATPDGAAAMLMYQDVEGRRISFYVRPSTRFADARGSRLNDGLALRYWYRNGYGFAVVGRADDPRTLAVQQAIPPAV